MATNSQRISESAARAFAALLYEQGPIQRFTQDSPILPDVWIAFARQPDAPLDLLLNPWSSTRTTMMPGELSSELKARLRRARGSAQVGSSTSLTLAHRALAYNESIVAVKLTFEELIRVILPMSGWWRSQVERHQLEARLVDLDQPRHADIVIEALSRYPADEFSPPPGNNEPSESHSPPFGLDVLWLIRIVGTIAMLRDRVLESDGANPSKIIDDVLRTPGMEEMSLRRNYFRRLVTATASIFDGLVIDREASPSVHVVNVNRKASVTVWKSTLAVKADAARQLFSLSCRHLTWAVIDSGIDARHPSFRMEDQHKTPCKLSATESWSECTRVVKTYDFTMIRQLLSYDSNGPTNLPPRAVDALRRNPELRKKLSAIVTRIGSGLDVDWGLVLPLIEIPHDDAGYVIPAYEHGTHVAGILGACWKRGDAQERETLDLLGVCPDIRLYDLRVLDGHGMGDEFDVIAALQAVRYLNSQKSRVAVHGVNLSLAIPHQVMNYACGRTPVCEECDRLWRSGVVVVAAAGNRGYIRDMLDSDNGYRSISITDPGNGERLITVGSTHRDKPHTYGVSFFSSRGPTGDGRVKPDLVAPGEKIESCVPNGKIRRLDGTSMAAPHVSGAAALLMSRHHELIGDPDRIKSILCETATDLGREHYFQGHGMLDVLRALQHV